MPVLNQKLPWQPAQLPFRFLSNAEQITIYVTYVTLLPGIGLMSVSGQKANVLSTRHVR
jgi:hypothetical protein